ncbi:hypothetical protein KDW_27530 [Dictyobacter vulcani]|uniref:DUF4097 domain-containing protein n=1 Tax=Dictyobacter vulcani TaxID=2607529 RepID=A0A5J4KQC9_9CHLR|nr:DUF4097 family beta strand repeat-containing protein [Dictyobacter vulcani]GER88591.1 hypothetical protein KDW_27530 [Dictyobacter vulcani]
MQSQSQEDPQMAQGQGYVPNSEHSVNQDPREQPSTQQYSVPPGAPYQERSYQEGYSYQSSYDDSWFQESAGEKLRPPQNTQHGISTIMLVLGALLLGIVIGNFFGILGSGLAWPFIIVLVLVGAFVIYSNWRVVTTPLPVESFQIQEYARLNIQNTSGTVSIRKGEQNEVTVSATKRASGPWVTAKNMRMDYDQRGDALNIKSHIHFTPFQFGFRAIDLEITVPQHCEIQLKNGSGIINLQDINGSIKARTGSGSLTSHNLQGQLILSTGSGRIEADNLSGRIDLQTGSGRIIGTQLNGEVRLKTGSGRIIGTQLNGEVRLKTGSGRVELTDMIGHGNIISGSGRITLAMASLNGIPTSKRAVVRSTSPDRLNPPVTIKCVQAVVPSISCYRI